MVSWSGVVFLAFLGTIVSVSGFPWSMIDVKYQCPKVYDIPCQKDIECPCSFERLICNYNSVCREISIMDITVRQRCPKMFKRKCYSSDECRCPGMACVDKECVYDKNTIQ